MKRILLLSFLVFQVIASQGQINEKLEAMQLVEKNRESIGLTDLNDVYISYTYKVAGTGMTMVYLQQIYKGIPVFNRLLVLAFKEGKLVSNAGQLITDIDKLVLSNSPVPSISSGEAVRLAFVEEKLSVPAIRLIRSTENGRVNEYAKPTGIADDLTAELFWFPMEKENPLKVKLGWQVQLAPPGKDDIWHIRLDALTGKMIEKVNLTIYEDFDSHRRRLNRDCIEPGTGKPGGNLAELINQIQGKSAIGFDNPKTIAGSPDAIASANYLVIPYPIEAPSFGAAATRNNPWTAAPGNATTLGWHSDGTTDYTISRGNNVWATEDTIATNQNTGLPATSSTGPDPLNFLNPPNYNVEPSRNPIMQQFCITNLFYWNNVIHDILYVHGFDEPSRNFQQNNQGRGGLGNDHVMALAQSGAAGHIGNNANFSTPADGQRGRMRMYLFDSVSRTTLHVNTPGSIAGDYTAVESAFSTANKLVNVGPVSGQVVFYNDDAAGNTHYACNPPANSLTGKVALIIRGFGGAICTTTVPFTVKVKNAQDAGAIAVIMVDNVVGPLVQMGGTDNTITIPAVFISQADGAILIAQLGNNLTVTMSAIQTAVLDGDLDAGIMVHEFGHGISNRLTGSGSGCLGNAEQGGEGWGDYFALMLTTNWSALNVSSGTNLRPVGTYVFGQATNGGGLRNYPYTTNIVANPLTYAHMGIAGAPWRFSDGNEVHNTGEIWCAALWEMTWGIIQQENSINNNLYNFSLLGTGGNNIALKLVIEGCRLQNCSPGFLDARNAILTADMNFYGGRHQCAIWTAFAKRGMGYGAIQGSAFSTTDHTAAFNLPPAPTINTQPVDVTVNPGQNANFTVAATPPVNGAYLLYSWEVSTNGGANWNPIAPAVTTPSLTLTAVTVSMNGYKYRCVITQGCATTTSSVATLTVTSPLPTITSHPANLSVCEGSVATFSVTATGSGTLTYQWQVNTGSGFGNVPAASPYTGSTTNTLTITGATLAMNGYQYQCIVTLTGSVTSNIATLTVNPGPVINGQPSNVTVCAGSPAAFTVSTSGPGIIYQWQVNTGSGFNNIPAANAATLNLPAVTGSMNGYQYQCIVSNASCPAGITSTIATLTVNTAPAITSHPTSASVCTGANHTFSVGTTGSGLTYLWYLSTDGVNFNPMSNGGVYSGVLTANLLITGVTVSLNNNQYRCVVSGTCPSPVTSNAATLTITTSLSITGQPTDAIICAGQNTSFAVTAVGAGTYQWEFSTDGVNYNNVTNGGVYSGAQLATLNITGATAVLNGNRYRCKLTSSCGNATSTAALLTVNTLPAISTQPADATLCVGANNTFSVVASGTGISYQWQISLNGCAGAWNDILGATSSSYTLTGITAGQNNTGYRCIVTGTCAPQATSNCALLTVVTSVAITGQPASQIVCAGGNTSFTVVGSGSGIIYQWQVNTGSGFNNIPVGAPYTGITTATLSITGATVSMNGYQYRCLLSNSTCTTPGTSNPATLTVNTLPAVATQPANVSVCVGGNTSFTATGTGTGFSYQWQVSTDGINYNNVSGPIYSGATTSTLVLTGVTAVLNNNRYRLVVSGTCAPPANSNGAILTIVNQVTITTQPVNAAICSGSNATFTVTGSSTETINYQWQLSTNGGSTWTNIPGANASSYTVTGGLVAMNGNQYQVLLSNTSCTSPTTSISAILVVRPLPTIGLTAAPLSSLLPGQTTTLTATPGASAGGILSTSWLYNGATPVPAITGTSYIVNAEKTGTYQVRINETWTGGLVCTNLSPLVTISGPASNRLFIFPTPNDGTFTVSYYNNGGSSTERQIVIHDSKGAMVYKRKFPITGAYTLININMKQASTGIYTVVVHDVNGNKLAEGRVHIR